MPKVTVSIPTRRAARGESDAATSAFPTTVYRSSSVTPSVTASVTPTISTYCG